MSDEFKSIQSPLNYLNDYMYDEGAHWHNDKYRPVVNCCNFTPQLNINQTLIFFILGFKWHDNIIILEEILYLKFVIGY